MPNCDATVGTFCAEYYDNRNLSGQPTFTRNEAEIDHDWGRGGPGNGVGKDNFSIRWQGWFMFQEGDSAFTVLADDGIRLWVDGELLINEWRNQRTSSSYSATKSLLAGDHLVKVEYYEYRRDAVVRLEIA